jgi:hypothetical protein
MVVCIIATASTLSWHLTYKILDVKNGMYLTQCCDMVLHCCVVLVMLRLLIVGWEVEGMLQLARPC